MKRFKVEGYAGVPLKYVNLEKNEKGETILNYLPITKVNGQVKYVHLPTDYDPIVFRCSGLESKAWFFKELVKNFAVEKKGNVIDIKETSTQRPHDTYLVRISGTNEKDPYVNNFNKDILDISFLIGMCYDELVNLKVSINDNIYTDNEWIKLVYKMIETYYRILRPEDIDYIDTGTGVSISNRFKTRIDYTDLSYIKLTVMHNITIVEQMVYLNVHLCIHNKNHKEDYSTLQSKITCKLRSNDGYNIDLEPLRHFIMDKIDYMKRKGIDIHTVK